MAADVKAIMRRWDELKAARLDRESEWQLIADYFMPRKSMTLPLRQGQLRRRRIATGVGMSALKRSTALITAYMVDVAQPFIKPNVDRGLVQSGRRPELDAAARDFLETVEWGVFDRMMLPQGGFLSGVARTNLELAGFGTGVLWTGRRRGFGPRYQARPLRACWIAESEDGEIDTLYFAYRLPAWRCVRRFPAALAVKKIRELAEDDKKANTPVELLHVVEPRDGGAAGAVATRKPFADVVVAWEHKAVLEEGGYESFPYSVPRLNVEEGSCYGTGLAWEALPDVMVYNHLQAAVERGVELRNEPPLMYPERMFGKPLDRRPGAANPYDQAGLGFGTAKDAIQKLDIAGDVSVGDAYLQRLQANIEKAFYVDWMSLRDNGNVTAEEIRERRDLRLKAMSSIVPSIDRDLIGRAGDRTLEAMIEEQLIPDPPPSLRGIEVDWDYAGPLAMAQRQGQGDAIVRLLGAATQAHNLDPSATAVLALEEGLRALAEAWGAPPAALRSREEVEQVRAEMAQQRQDEAAAREAATQAQAFRDASQGAANLAGADQMAEAA